MEDHGVVVGKGDAAAAEPFGRGGDRLGRGRGGQGLDLARLADVPVLAEAAGEIAAGGAERKDWRARTEKIEGVLLRWVGAEDAGAAMGREDHAIALPRPHEAEPALAIAQLAEARAEVALKAPVRQCVPIARRHATLRRRIDRHDAGAWMHDRMIGSCAA